MELYNRELEINIISTFLASSFLAESEIGKVKSDFFYFEDTRLAFEEINSMILAGESISKGSFYIRIIKHKKRDKLKNIALDDGTYSLDVLKNNIGQLMELNAQRSLKLIGLSINQKIQDGDTSADINSYLNTAMLNTLSNNAVGEVINMKTALSIALSEIVANMAKDGVVTGVDSGIRTINEFYGGWQDTDVVLVGGRPGSGKTVFGLEVAKNASKSGVKVLFLSLEMSTSSLINRMISGQLEDVSFGAIKTAKFADKEAMLRRINIESVSELEKLPIFWYDGDDRDIANLEMVITKERYIHDIGLVVIDYIQLIQDKTKNDLEYAQVTSVSKRLKQLQKRLKIPIIELSQLSRECEKRKGDERCPQLSDFRSSGQLEQDASVVIGLYRPDYYGQKEQDSGEFYQDTNELWLDVLKARDGRTVTIKTACDIKTCRIRNTQEELEIKKNATKKVEITDQSTHAFATNKVFEQVGSNSFIQNKEVPF